MPDELLMRQVPQDLTAEQSLLGAMLVDPNCIPEVIEQVRADDFYAEENKRIFETIYSMFNGAQRIDPVTVLDMLTRMGYYDDAHKVPVQGHPRGRQSAAGDAIVPAQLPRHALRRLAADLPIGLVPL